MKTIIAGTRTFNDYAKLSMICKNINITEVVSGTARGADKLGEQYATEKQIPIKQFPPDWDKYGKSAGPVRNEQMAKYAECLVAFWDGKSAGTENMIETAKRNKLEVILILY